MAGAAFARESRSVLERERRAEFTTEYVRAWPDVFRYAFVLTRHREDAEDVAAETFRRALEAAAEGRVPTADLLPWLFTIARRIAIDRHRRRRLIAWIPLDGVTERPDDSQAAAFRKSDFLIWFEQLSRLLPADQREALFLRFQFDLCDEDAARVAGTSAANIRTRVSRGLARLRAHPEVMER